MYSFLSLEELQIMRDRHAEWPGAVSAGFTTCLCGDVAAYRLGVTCDRESRFRHPKVEEITMLSRTLYRQYWDETVSTYPGHRVGGTVEGYMMRLFDDEIARRKAILGTPPAPPAPPKTWVETLIDETKKLPERAHEFAASLVAWMA